MTLGSPQLPDVSACKITFFPIQLDPSNWAFHLQKKKNNMANLSRSAGAGRSRRQRDAHRDSQDA